MSNREWFVMSNPFAEKQQMTMVRGQFKQVQQQQQRAAVARWIGQVLSVRIPDDTEGFAAALKDGEQLLKLLQAIAPEIKLAINTGRGLNEFKIRENLNQFLEGVKKIGVRISFLPGDLVEKKNIQAVVNVLLDLGTVSRQRGFSPAIGDDEHSSPSSRPSAGGSPSSREEESNHRQEEAEFVELVRKSDEVNDFIQQVEAHKPVHTSGTSESSPEFELELHALREEVERLKAQGITTPFQSGATAEEQALPPAPKVDPRVEQELRKLREEVEMLRVENKEILNRSTGSPPVQNKTGTPTAGAAPFGNTPATKADCSCFVVTPHNKTDTAPVVLKIDLEGISLLTPYTEQPILSEPWRRIRSWAVNGGADILKVEYLIAAAAQSGREEFEQLEFLTVEARLILNAFLIWVGKKREQMKLESAGVPTNTSTPSSNSRPGPQRKGSGFFNRKKGK